MHRCCVGTCVIFVSQPLMTINTRHCLAVFHLLDSRCFLLSWPCSLRNFQAIMEQLFLSTCHRYTQSIPFRWLFAASLSSLLLHECWTDSLNAAVQSSPSMLHCSCFFNRCEGFMSSFQGLMSRNPHFWDPRRFVALLRCSTVRLALIVCFSWLSSRYSGICGIDARHAWFDGIFDTDRAFFLVAELRFEHLRVLCVIRRHG